MNQVDTEWMRQQCQKSGVAVMDTLDDSTIAVVNSCAVTSRAETDVARWVKKAVAKNKSVIVTGCLTKECAVRLKESFGVSSFLFGGARGKIAYAVRQVASGKSVELADDTDMKAPGISFMSGKTRGFLKIEEGCTHRCSYCIIPALRGRKIVSRPIDMVVDDVKTLLYNGYKEIVISGTDIGAYGKDLGYSLYELLRRLILIEGDFRIRISSIGVIDLNDNLISLMENEKICRHLHISLQSGSDKILSLMRRPYNTAFYGKKIEAVVNRVPDIAIGTDVIVGFPGEDEDEFKKTAGFVSDMPFVYLHPFSYSPRIGAESYCWQYEKSAQKRRIKVLKAIVKKKNLIYRRQFLGRQVKVLAENEKQGRTSYYFPVSLPHGLKRGFFYDVLIRNVDYDNTQADIV